MEEPLVNVGIITSKEVNFVLSGFYLYRDHEIKGRQLVCYNEGFILWQGKKYKELLFTPINPNTDFFELKNVTIGINFHWERSENQRFLGSLKIIVDKDKKITAINIIPVEKYLESVISSEMSANASLELLKAHSVISRSWLLSNISHKKDRHKDSYVIKNKDGYLRWYDREVHTQFDVCADDHCQRYEGITHIVNKRVTEAISKTCGEVLTYNGEICDARFSKCCGGMFEEFQNCWENQYHPYLQKGIDKKFEKVLPDLTLEIEAEKWIRSIPQAFCNTTNEEILSQILNDYDQETKDFYRWKVKYTQSELAKIIKEKSGVYFGDIIDLIPLERGTSGRLIRLKIVGTEQSMIIGKELEIRRILSMSHLYSSAFVVDKYYTKDNDIPVQFVLTGAGWGHGVGLCQIGAAVMGANGYKYDEILQHYFTGALIEKNY